MNIGDLWFGGHLDGAPLKVDARKAGEAAGTTFSGSFSAKVKGSALLKGGLLAGIGAGLAQSAMAATGAVGDFFAGNTKAASDLAESVSKSNVIFGNSARVIEAFGNTAAHSLGISKQAAIEAAATFGNIFVGLDIAQPEAAEMSKSLVRLAGDLSSFNNLDPSVTLEKLRSGLAGEAEPLRAVGVFLTEAKVKAKAMELGLSDSHGELSEGAKILARYQLILEQTGTAQGDFARTSDGLANSQRIANAELENTRAQLGLASQPLALLTTQLQVNFHRGLRVATDDVLGFGHSVADFLDILTPWDSATERATKRVEAMGDAAQTSVYQVERAATNMADSAAAAGAAFVATGANAVSMQRAIDMASGSAAKSVENMKNRIVAAALGIVSGAYGNITTADALSATNSEIAAQRRIVAMGGAASGTDKATAALDRQAKALDRASDAERTHADALTAALDLQISQLDISERQLAIEQRRHDLNDQLNRAQLDLVEAQGGTDAQAISDAMAKVQDIKEQQVENERQLGVDAQRDRLEAQKAEIQSKTQARQDEITKLKAQLDEQRRAINVSGSASVADAKARLHELFQTQAEEVLALALAGKSGSKEVADALADMKARLTTATGDERIAIEATIKALKDLQSQAERTFVLLPGGGSIARPTGATGGPTVRDSGPSGSIAGGRVVTAGAPVHLHFEVGGKPLLDYVDAHLNWRRDT